MEPSVKIMDPEAVFSWSTNPKCMPLARKYGHFYSGSAQA